MRKQLTAFVAGLLVAVASVTLLAQGVRLMDGAGSSLLGVNAFNALSIVQGRQSRQAYVVAATSAFTAVDSILNLEAESGRGFIITKVCVNPGSATAAVNTLWQLIRRTTASSAGTAITAEVTSGNNALARMDPANNTWAGAARTGGTEGTAGAILDSGNVFVSIAATGATGLSLGGACKTYGDSGEQGLVVASGTANGVSLMFTGTAGGTGQSASIHFIAF